MKKRSKKLINIIPGSRSFLFVIIILWTAIISVSLLWNLWSLNEEVIELAKSHAEASYEKDVIYRLWNTNHGGVYVPVTNETQHNIYLDLKEKNITSKSGKEYTLITPALMTRQVYELSKEKFGLVGHMTSLYPINPDNKPDEWEKNALNLFQIGMEKYSSVIEIDGEEHLRFMRPLITEKGCLNCHVHEGYKVGEIRGGISLTVPMSNFVGILKSQTQALIVAHIILWLIGVGLVHSGTQKVQRNIKVLRESEERLRDITLNSNDWIWEVDAEGIYTFVSGNTEQILGLSENVLLGTALFDLIVDDTKKKMSKIIKSRMAKKEVIKDLESWIIRKDGEEVCLLTNAVPMFDKKNNLIGYRGVDKDITEEKKAEAKIRHLQKMKSIGTLAAGIAHEINTPAQFINDNLSFLKDAYEDIKPLLNITANLEDNSTSINVLMKAKNNIDLNYLKKEIPIALEQSIKGVEKVSKIIKAMRDYTHAGPKEKISSDIHMIIENSLTLSRATWKFVTKIEKIYDETLPPIVCQPSELNQVLINLIVNASHALEEKYKNSDAIEGIIKLETGRNKNLIEIIISDNGSGMSEKVSKRIFDPFYTTKEVGKGTGQGLAIAHDIIVNKHNGNIEVESEKNVGAKFIIQLPVNNMEDLI